MPSPHDNNWQSDLPPSETQGQPQQQENPYKNMIMAQVAMGLFVAVISVAAWEKVISPVVESFRPPYERMASEVSPEAVDLIQASIKNCRSDSNEYSRRACKSVWANVRIPALDETSTANVNVPRN
jgi:hypothetical protein